MLPRTRDAAVETARASALAAPRPEELTALMLDCC